LVDLFASHSKFHNEELESKFEVTTKKQEVVMAQSVSGAYRIIKVETFHVNV